MVDKEFEKGSFKIGEICYMGYEARSAKSADTYESTSIYYFSIDGLKSEHIGRPYFPFKEQFKSLKKTLVHNKCYKAQYIEVNFLIYKERRVYQLIEKD